MRIRRIVLGSILLMFTVLISLALRPVPNATWDNCEKVSGKVVNISEAGGDFDVVFSLENDPTYYYVNRGLESGLNLHELASELLQEKIDLYYVKHWTPLDPSNSSQHIARIEYNGKVIYNEIASGQER